jgi:hypothetical protein
MRRADDSVTGPAMFAQRDQAYRVNFHVTAALLYGGMRLPLEMGAVVDGVETAAQTPDSGQASPVRAVVPRGLRVEVVMALFLNANP